MNGKLIISKSSLAQQKDKIFYLYFSIVPSLRQRFFTSFRMTGFFVVLERASASEGPHKKLACTLMFLKLTKCKIVKAETLRCAQSDQSGRGRHLRQRYFFHSIRENKKCCG